MKTFGGISLGCLGLIVLVVLSIGTPIAVWGFKVYFAEEKGRGDAHIQLQSAPNRISAYDEFFSICASVQNAEVAIDSESARLATTTDEVTKRRIDQNLSGLHATRGRAINEYNANAAKNYTDGQFRDSDLPYQLSTAPYVAGGTKTLCAAS